MPKLYVLTPNIRGLKEALSNKFEYFSLISSVSDAFQIKNTRKNLLETKVQIKEMINLIKETNNGCDKKIKLYLSCIDHCPIDGKVNSETIIQEILHYYSFYDNELDEICLSDTCGNLTISSFREIMETLINVVRMNTSKISLHLLLYHQKYTKRLQIYVVDIIWVFTSLMYYSSVIVEDVV